LGAPDALSMLSGTAAPLLAGFCITFVGLIIQAEGLSRFPGVALVLLASAAILLLYCVQCGFWARNYYVSPEAAIPWFEDYSTNLGRRVVVHREQVDDYAIYTMWAKRARRSYALAIIAMLTGVAVTLIPAEPFSQHVLQLVASGMFAMAALGELMWALSALKH
jgi:hypothetical protein